MEIYIITLVILLVFSFLELRTNLSPIQYKSMSFIVFALFVFQVGTRWQTGTDWAAYWIHFEETNTISDVYHSLTGFEHGYGYFVLFVKYLWNDYTVYLTFHALIYYFFIFKAFQRLTPYLFISLMVFYASTMGVMGSNRQLFALGICLYALRYIIDKNTIKFFLFIGIAFLFHRTALLFSVFFFLNRDIKQSWILGILVVSIFLGKTSFPYFAFSFVGDFFGGIASSKVSLYLERSEGDLLNQQLSILGFLKRLVFLGLFMYNYKYLTAKLPFYKIAFNGYFVGLVLYFMFSSSLLIIVNRGSLYFNVMEVFLIACQFLVIKNKHYKVNLLILLFIISIFLFLQSIASYSDLFLPYKGIFINDHIPRPKYSPYDNL